MRYEAKDLRLPLWRPWLIAEAEIDERDVDASGLTYVAVEAILVHPSGVVEFESRKLREFAGSYDPFVLVEALDTSKRFRTGVVTDDILTAVLGVEVDTFAKHAISDSVSLIIDLVQAIDERLIMATAEKETKRQVQRLSLVDACRLADYVRTNAACIEFRTSAQSYQALADWIVARSDWNGTPVPVGSLQAICEEYGLSVGTAKSDAVDQVARDAISALSKAWLEYLDVIEQTPAEEQVRVAINEATAYAAG